MVSGVDPAIFSSEHSSLIAPFKLPSSILAETVAANFASESFEGRDVVFNLGCRDGVRVG